MTKKSPQEATAKWGIGHRLYAVEKRRGWGAAVIPRLAKDLRNELPEIKGFSERNFGYMLAFAREDGPPPILQQPVAKLPFHILGRIVSYIQYFAPKTLLLRVVHFEYPLPDAG